MNALKDLLKFGQVQEGMIVHFETIPIPLLLDAPLIKGERLDRRLVELAEWGSLLQAKGYHLDESEVAHNLEAGHFIRKDGEKVRKRKINLWPK